MNESLRQHLLSRGCNPDLYHVHLDEDARVATFMLFSLTGVLVGYQTYRPESVKNTSEGRKLGFDPKQLKYYTYAVRDRQKMQPYNVMFGLENFDFRKRKLYVVEGLFDAVKLHSLGLNAVAMLCNNPSESVRQFLWATRMKVVGVLDSDAAGRKLASVCHEYFLCPPGRDPGDMTTDELKELLCL